MRGVGCYFFRVALNLLDCSSDFVHVLFIAKQGELRNPYRFPGCPLRMRKLLIEEGVFFGGLWSGKAFAVIAAAEAVKFVQRRVAGLGRDAFRV